MRCLAIVYCPPYLRSPSNITKTAEHNQTSKRSKHKKATPHGEDELSAACANSAQSFLSLTPEYTYSNERIQTSYHLFNDVRHMRAPWDPPLTQWVVYELRSCPRSLSSTTTMLPPATHPLVMRLVLSVCGSDLSSSPPVRALTTTSTGLSDPRGQGERAELKFWKHNSAFALGLVGSGTG